MTLGLYNSMSLLFDMLDSSAYKGGIREAEERATLATFFVFTWLF
jgi:hypothetical protein